MGTRGSVGFIVGEEEKLTYNHFDSYPGGLGLDVLAFCRRQTNWDEVREHANRIILVDEETPPTEHQIKRLIAEGVVNLGVGEQSLDDWYCLMREAQGQLNAYLELGLMPGGGADFMLESLFCEWAYVVNLDTNTLEVYRGFQTEPHEEGRFAKRGEPKPAYEGADTYYPVRLIGAWSLTELPDDDHFLKALALEDEEDE